MIRSQSNRLSRFTALLLGPLLALTACGDHDDDAGPSGGGSGGSSSGAGGGKSDAGNAGTNNPGGGSAAGGAGGAGGSGGSGGKGGVGSGGKGGMSNGGSGVVLGDWTDISPPGSNGLCSGVVVDRLTGALSVDVSDQGVWRSTNGGADWARVDNDVVTGHVVMGPGFDVDQEHPERMAAWSLDGKAGWTNDGVTWNGMKTIGRNWDFGSIDWATPEPQTMIVTRHEANGEVYLSSNAGVDWELMSIKVYASLGTYPPVEFAMVGVMDATTLIYSDGYGDGIHRSTDRGTSFTKVSDFNPRTRVPVLFKGAFYLGGDGLIVSRDKGATWQQQGAPIEMWVGPHFGADESHMMMANNDGVYLTSNAGETWTKVATIPPQIKYQPRVWGGFAWDSLANVLYTGASGMPLLKLEL